MASPIYGMLAQSAPSATTLTAAYTVPSGRRATVKVVVANRGGADTFRLAISPDGASIVNQHYLAYDEPVEANASITSTAIAVGSTDVVRVYSTAGAISFSVVGIEEDE